MNDKIKIYTLKEILNEKNIDKNEIFKTFIGIKLNDKKEAIISEDYYEEVLSKSINNSLLCIEKTNPGHAEIYQKIYKNIKKNYSWGIDNKTDLKKEINQNISNIYNIENINQNYKFCHIWGYSRNPFLNCAYWNTWYVPYIYSELTEKNRGEYSIKIQQEFKFLLLNNKNINKKIMEYNNNIYKELYNERTMDILNQNINKKYDSSTVRIGNILKQLIFIDITTGEETPLFIYEEGKVKLNDIEKLSNYGIKE